jgi:hypothetical protein
MAVNRFRETVPRNAHGKLYEQRVAKKTAIRLTPASGAMPGAKGDGRLSTEAQKWLVEMKSTDKNTHSIELGWLVKITEEAAAAGRNPALLFSFVLKDGRPRPNAPTEWVAMPLYLFEELTKKK